MKKIPSLEPQLEIIVGCMKSGKTTELRRRIKVYGKRKKLLVTSSLDSVKLTHDGKTKTTHFAETVAEIPKLFNISKVQLIAIDEGQFFPDLVSGVKMLLDLGKSVTVAGLDCDYTGKPFEQMCLLLASCDNITKLHATCVSCHKQATFSHRLEVGDKGLIDTESKYEPMCRKCFLHFNKLKGDSPAMYLKEIKSF